MSVTITSVIRTQKSKPCGLTGHHVTSLQVHLNAPRVTRRRTQNGNTGTKAATRDVWGSWHTRSLSLSLFLSLLSHTHNMCIQWCSTALSVSQRLFAGPPSSGLIAALTSAFWPRLSYSSCDHVDSWGKPRQPRALGFESLVRALVPSPAAVCVGDETGSPRQACLFTARYTDFVGFFFFRGALACDTCCDCFEKQWLSGWDSSAECSSPRTWYYSEKSVSYTWTTCSFTKRSSGYCVAWLGYPSLCFHRTDGERAQTDSASAVCMFAEWPKDDDDDEDDDDVELRVLGCRVDILGTNCGSMVRCSIKTIRLIRTGSPGRPPRLSHSSWTLIYIERQVSTFYSFLIVKVWIMVWPWFTA